MTYGPRSPIRGPAPMTAQQAFAAVLGAIPASEREDVRRWIDTVWTVGRELEFDSLVILAQAVLETGWFSSSWWRERRNSGGIGITGDPAQNAASQTWSDGEQSALGHLAHMTAYVYPNTWHVVWPTDMKDPEVFNRRFWAPINAGYHAERLDDLTNRWAVDGQYGTKIASRANELIERAGVVTTPSTPEQEPAMGTLNFGRVPHPQHERSIVYKPAPGNGYTAMPNGRGSIVGMAWHEWMDGGEAGAAFYRGFFACAANPCPSGFHCHPGARCRDALTDYHIRRDGTIVMTNDPRGTRSPWASGGGGPYAGDGPAFVSRFGTAAVNARLVSVELCKRNNESPTAAQIQSAGRLAAYWHDQDGQAWHEHPYTSKYRLVTSIAHFEVGATTCMMDAHDLRAITEIQAVTKAVMKQHQTSTAAPNPIPPDVPPLPAPPIPGGLTLNQARSRFGEARRHKDGRVTTGHGFDPNGPISLTWAHRAAVENVYPKIEDWYVLEDSGETFQLVTFSNDWRLVRAAERAAWEWMAFESIQLPDAA